MSSQPSTATAAATALRTHVTRTTPHGDSAAVGAGRRVGLVLERCHRLCLGLHARRGGNRPVRRLHERFDGLAHERIAVEGQRHLRLVAGRAAAV